MITDEIKEEVKLAADIVEVVSDRVKLKRAGNGFTGLCPFHNEKSPSFHVSPQLGIYKCFGCGRAGDVFSFVMEQEGLDFIGAVKALANRYNIAIPDEAPGFEDPNRHEKEGIYHALQFATTFFHNSLREGEEAAEARAYFSRRGLKREILKEYLLGYSPNQWRGLSEAAKTAGINESYLHKAGLIKEATESGRENYDTFRDRIMFPVINTMGRVIAFGGRLMGDVKAAKYINSPQTLVYNKSEALYGINVAKNEIRKHEEAIMVEGYMDVLQLHQAGVKNVVSTSGTALTTQQVSLLHRFGDKLTMIFDADSAGQNAMTRAIPIALEEGLAVKLLKLPDGEDPDTFVKQFGKEGFLGYKKRNTVDFLHFLINSESSLSTWEDIRHKKQVVSRVLQFIAIVPDEMERDVMVQQLNHLTGIGDRALTQDLKQILATKSRKEKVDRNRQKQEIAPKREEIPVQEVAKPLPQVPAEAKEMYVGDEPPPFTDSDIPIFDEEELAQNLPIATQAQIVAPEEILTEKSISKAPKFEGELIRLMLSLQPKNELMIMFISDHIKEEYFESEICKQLFVDLITRFKEEKDVSISFYMTREHPYPMLVGELLIDRHVISEKGQEMLKANYNEEFSPYKRAKSAMKSLELSYCERQMEDLSIFINLAKDEEEKKRLMMMMADLVRYKSKLNSTSNEKLYPNPPWLEKH